MSPELSTYPRDLADVQRDGWANREGQAVFAFSPDQRNPGGMGVYLCARFKCYFIDLISAGGNTPAISRQHRQI